MTRRAAIAALGGACVPARDPLTDPRPWDVVEKNGFQCHVHNVTPEQIYVGRFYSTGEAIDTTRCNRRTWREQCVGAVVIQRAEDVFDGA